MIVIGGRGCDISSMVERTLIVRTYACMTMFLSVDFGVLFGILLSNK